MEIDTRGGEEGGRRERESVEEREGLVTEEGGKVRTREGEAEGVSIYFSLSRLPNGPRGESLVLLG